MESSFMAGLAFKAASTCLNYGAEIAGGYCGYNYLNNIVKNAASSGLGVAGKAGEWVGKNVVGPMIAGGNIQEAANAANTISSTLKSISAVALDYAAYELASRTTTSDDEKKTKKFSLFKADGSQTEIEDIAEANEKAAPKKKDFDYSAAATKALQAGTALIGTAGLLTGAGSVVPLAFAAANAVPRLVKAFKDENDKALDFVDDIIKPVAKELAFGAAGVLAGNIAGYNTIKNAYNESVAKTKAYGTAIDKCLPKCLQQAEKIATCVGKLEAGRVAMSDAVLNKAQDVAAATQILTEKGAKILLQHLSTEGEVCDNAYLETARKAGWVALGVLSGAALVSCAPELALVCAGTSIINISDRLVRYLKGQVIDDSKPVVAEKVSTESYQEAAVETEVVAAEEKAEEALFEKSTGIAAKEEIHESTADKVVAVEAPEAIDAEDLYASFRASKSC